jgi:hypothetical protein
MMLVKDAVPWMASEKTRPGKRSHEPNATCRDSSAEERSLDTLFETPYPAWRKERRPCFPLSLKGEVSARETR